MFVGDVEVDQFDWLFEEVFVVGFDGVVKFGYGDCYGLVWCGGFVGESVDVGL